MESVLQQLAKLLFILMAKIYIEKLLLGFTLIV